MSPSKADTQSVPAIQSGPGCLKRLVQLMILVITAVSIAGIFALGYATGSGVEILAPANALIETAIASLPDSIQAPSERSPLPTFTAQPADTHASVTTDTYTPVLTDTPIPTDTPAPTDTPTNTPSDTPIPTDTPTDTPVPTNTPTYTPIPTDTPTDTPVPTNTPSDTPIPTDTPTDTPVPTNTPSDTPIPTNTPTDTPIPTATEPLPTRTPTAPSCYHNQQVWVTGDMNVREQPSINAKKVGSADAGESFNVLESRQGDSYCWLRVNRGWMARTALVSATKPQVRVPSSAGSGVRQALNTLNALVVAPEHRCSPYDSDSYPYSQSVEAQIVARLGGRIYGPYTGATFSSTRETDIEHIVAKSEAHDSGLCSASAHTRRTFSNDLLNLTLASPTVNRHQKSGKDFAEWTPALNRCWFADTIIKVKSKYRLTVDSREKAALERTLLSCSSVSMLFSGAARSVAPTSAPARQPASSSPKPAASEQYEYTVHRWRLATMGYQWKRSHYLCRSASGGDCACTPGAPSLSTHGRSRQRWRRLRIASKFF